MKEKKIQFRGRDFVLNDRSKENEVLDAYRSCIGEIQVISDNVYSETYMDELKRYARRIIRTRNDFIKGFYYFAKYGVSEDLATVISNGKILINNQADRVSAEKREAPMRKVFPGDYSEEETKESEVLEFGGFYLDVIQLDKNPKKREVLQAYRAGVENAQDISDRVNSVNDLESLKKLSLEVTEWRYAFIKGFEHFAGSRVSQDLGVVVGNLASTLHDKAAIVKHDGLGSSWR